MYRILMGAFALCAMTVLSLNAQPVMQSGDLVGEPGTTIIFDTNLDLVPVDMGPSGANQTWNFTSITTNFEQAHHWVDPATTPYAANFPDANRSFYIAEVEPMYHYFEHTPSNYWTLGYGSEIMVTNYNNTQPLLTFPVQYGDIWDTVYSYDMMGMLVTDSTRYEVDGYGTVIDGQNTYHNILRTKSHKIITTTLMGMPVSTVTSWTYSWEEVGYGSVASMTSDIDEPNPNFTMGYFGRIIEITGVEELPDIEMMPISYSLDPAYPNPFNPQTNLTFHLPVAGDAVLSIFDVQGKEVTTLHNGWLQPGSYHTAFSGDNLAGGVYIARLTAGNTQQTQKLVLVK